MYVTTVTTVTTGSECWWGNVLDDVYFEDEERDKGMTLRWR
jgi:hypothetical protein